MITIKEFCDKHDAEQYAVPVESANQQLQQILTIWEAAK